MTRDEAVEAIVHHANLASEAADKSTNFVGMYDKSNMYAQIAQAHAQAALAVATAMEWEAAQAGLAGRHAFDR